MNPLVETAPPMPIGGKEGKGRGRKGEQEGKRHQGLGASGTQDSLVPIARSGPGDLLIWPHSKVGESIEEL